MATNNKGNQTRATWIAANRQYQSQESIMDCMDLYSVATMAAQGFFKSLFRASGDARALQMKQGMYRAQGMIDMRARGTTATLGASGDVITIDHAALATLDVTLPDAHDMVLCAYQKLLAYNNAGYTPMQPVTVEHVHHNARIRDGVTIDAREVYKVITPFTLACRAVGKYWESLRGVRANRSKAKYVSADSALGYEDDARVPLRWDCDDCYDLITFESMIKRLAPALTDRQNQIMRLRLQGLNNVKIGAKLGCSETAIRKARGRIQAIYNAMIDADNK